MSKMVKYSSGKKQLVNLNPLRRPPCVATRVVKLSLKLQTYDPVIEMLSILTNIQTFCTFSTFQLFTKLTNKLTIRCQPFRWSRQRGMCDSGILFGHSEYWVRRIRLNYNVLITLTVWNNYQSVDVSVTNARPVNRFVVEVRILCELEFFYLLQ